MSKQTSYIKIEFDKCIACWNCISVCSNKVLSGVNILWHKHVNVVRGDKCVGCMRCVNVCASQVILKQGGHKND